MEIKSIEVYGVDIPLTSPYTMSGGRVWNFMETTIVKITTQSGIVGWGESCPWGPNYLTGHAKGVRAGLEELGPSLIGIKADEMDVLHQVMDHNLAGHGYVKHAVDMACFDAFGKSTGLPLYVLLGGRHHDQFKCVASVPCGAPEKMVKALEDFREKQAYTVFSCKLSGELENDLACLEAVMESARPQDSFMFDANRGFNMPDAVRFGNALAGYDVVYEQPTKTYEEFKAVRQRCSSPMMIDEIFTGMDTMWQIIKDKSCEMINLKIGKVGGLTKARLIRDICQEHGMMVSVQCCGGSEITRAAIMHLAASTRKHYMHSIWDCTDHHAVKIVSQAPDVVNGTLAVPDLPGLGVEPDMAVLGEPELRFG